MTTNYQLADCNFKRRIDDRCIGGIGNDISLVYYKIISVSE